MKSSFSSPNLESFHYYKKNFCREKLGIFLVCVLGIAILFSFSSLYTPTTFKSITKQVLNKSETDVKNCNLFDGKWIPELNGPLYTNWSCPIIPNSKNCLKHGKMNVDYLNWRWKPHGCDLQRFNAKYFLGIVRGKTFAFIGDSVARNHAESLLCLLYQEEAPVDIFKDAENQFRTWYFPLHNFTIKVFWTRFLAMTEERILSNGTKSGVYDMHIDKVDKNWAEKLPGVDYTIISGAHWFNRPIHLHENGNVIACANCNLKNISSASAGFAIRKAFQTTLDYLYECKECGGMVTFVRTLAPSHFENGVWNTGGRCRKTRPYSEDEIDSEDSHWKRRLIQVEEFERIKKKGEARGKRFRLLDVTKAMLMRPDGHPDIHWGNQWMKGYSDCLHWCLPGPIDVWNDWLMALL